MSAPGGSSERLAWVALTAVLATALAWAAVACVAVLAGGCAHCPPEALVVVRALAHVAPALARVAGPPALTALLVAGLVVAALARGGRTGSRSTRHA